MRYLKPPGMTIFLECPCTFGHVPTFWSMYSGQCTHNNLTVIFHRVDLPSKESQFIEAHGNRSLADGVSICLEVNLVRCEVHVNGQITMSPF